MKELGEQLTSIFVDRNYSYLGHCQLVRTRVSDEPTTVLRQVRQEENFEPVTYNGGVLCFYLIEDEIVFNNYTKRSKTQITLVLLCPSYEDIKEITCLLDNYSYPNFTINTNSIQIYDKYFEQNEDRLFQQFAFELKLEVSF